MKIVMLNGQNHKGSTYHIGRMIAEDEPYDLQITPDEYSKYYS